METREYCVKPTQKMKYRMEAREYCLKPTQKKNNTGPPTSSVQTDKVQEVHSAEERHKWTIRIGLKKTKVNNTGSYKI